MEAQNSSPLLTGILKLTIRDCKVGQTFQLPVRQTFQSGLWCDRKSPQLANKNVCPTVFSQRRKPSSAGWLTRFVSEPNHPAATRQLRDLLRSSRAAPYVLRLFRCWLGFHSKTARKVRTRNQVRKMRSGGKYRVFLHTANDCLNRFDLFQARIDDAQPQLFVSPISSLLNSAANSRLAEWQTRAPTVGRSNE
jgi:hypothetical protein